MASGSYKSEEALASCWGPFHYSPHTPALPAIPKKESQVGKALNACCTSKGVQISCELNASVIAKHSVIFLQYFPNSYKEAFKPNNHCYPKCTVFGIFLANHPYYLSQFYAATLTHCHPLKPFAMMKSRIKQRVILRKSSAQR